MRCHFHALWIIKNYQSCIAKHIGEVGEWKTLRTKHLSVEGTKYRAVSQQFPALGCSKGNRRYFVSRSRWLEEVLREPCEPVSSAVPVFAPRCNKALWSSSRSGVWCLCAYACRQLWIFKTAEQNSFCNNEDFISGNKEHQLNVSFQRDDTDKASLQVTKQINMSRSNLFC